MRFRSVDGKDKERVIATVEADEIGRLSYALKVPNWVKKNTSYEVFLTSENQRIDSPAITITK